jgi:hypothetical protein
MNIRVNIRFNSKKDCHTQNRNGMAVFFCLEK